MSQTKSNRKKPQEHNKRSPWPIVLMVAGLALVAVVVLGSQLLKPGQEKDNSGPGTPALAISDIKSSPEAQIDGLKVDFGDMKLGAELASVVLTLSNTGDKALSFTKEPYIQLADGC
jgi:hypothetical protein